MSQANDPASVFLELVRGVGDGRWKDLAELYAEHAVVEHPLAIAGSPVPRWLRGRAQLREHFEGAGLRGLKMHAGRIQVHHTADPEVVIAEFKYVGHIAGNGQPFILGCIFVIRVQDGLIVVSWDYIGPQHPMGVADN